jgi:hypothetical protein
MTQILLISLISKHERPLCYMETVEKGRVDNSQAVDSRIYTFWILRVTALLLDCIREHHQSDQTKRFLL